MSENRQLISFPFFFISLLYRTLLIFFVRSLLNPPKSTIFFTPFILSSSHNFHMFAFVIRVCVSALLFDRWSHSSSFDKVQEIGLRGKKNKEGRNKSTNEKLYVRRDGYKRNRKKTENLHRRKPQSTKHDKEWTPGGRWSWSIFAFFALCTGKLNGVFLKFEPNVTW